MPDQRVEQADGAERESQHQPAEGQHERRAPLHLAAFEKQGGEAEQGAAGQVLDDAAGAQVHAAAEALLVQRAAGDRRQCHQHRGPGQAVGATVDAAEYHQGYASQAERQSQPLPAADLLAEPDAGQGRGSQRLQADQQGGQAGRHAVLDGEEHPAQVQAMDQQAGDRDMPGQPCRARPGRTAEQGEGGQQGGREEQADGQEGEGLGVRQAELGAEESSAPEQHEEQRHAAAEPGGCAHARSSSGGGGTVVAPRACRCQSSSERPRSR